MEVRLRKRLTAIGEELGIVIDRSLVDRLGIDEHTDVELSIEGDRLVLAPVRADDHRRRVAAATKRALVTHRTLLERLAR